MATAHPSSTPDSLRSERPHTIRAEVTTVGVVIGLSLVTLWFLAVAWSRVSNDYEKVRSIEAIHARQQEIVDAIGEMKKQNEILKSQNVRSMDERNNLYEGQGETKESLKVQKQSLDRLEKTTDYLKAVVEQAVAKDAARQKAREEATKKP